MSESTKPTRRHLWRALLIAAAALVTLAALGVVFLPLLLPASAVRRQVEGLLSERLGRRVTIESAGFRWFEGLRCTGLQVARRGGNGEGLFARADSLTVGLGLLDAARAAWGSNVPMDVVRIKGLEVWLVRDDQGRWNAGDLAGGEPLRARSIQITDASVHVENQALDRSVTLTGVNGSIGELITTGQGYVRLAAEVPGPTPGRVVVTASTNTLDPARRDAMVGSLKADWSGVAWSEALGMVWADRAVQNLVRRTSGRLSATFGNGAWGIEGAIQADGVRLPLPGSESDLSIPHAVFGFQVARNTPDEPLRLNLVKFSSPGINMHLSGWVKTRDVDRPEMDLHGVGTLAWAPLSQSIEPFRRFAERFERLDGCARLRFSLAGAAADKGLHLGGSVDLTDTRAVWRNILEKEIAEPLCFDLEATFQNDFSWVHIERADLKGEAGRVCSTARLPVSGGSEGDWSLRGASGELKAEVSDVRMLLAQIPWLRSALGRVNAEGPLEAHLKLSPGPADEEAAAWRVELGADLTGMAVRGPERAHKPAGTEARLDASAFVTGGARLARVQAVTICLGDATLAWRGTAEHRRPAEKGASGTARFDGTLSVEAMEAAGAILMPGRFASEAPPLAGRASVGVEATLVEGQLEGTLEADLSQAAIRIGEYFRKPSGGAATAHLAGKWLPGERNYLDGRAVLDLPGARIAFQGKSQVRVATQEGGSDEAPRFLLVRWGPVMQLDVRARTEDLAGALALSPWSAARLGDCVAGPVQAHLKFSSTAERVRVGGDVDLTAAAVNVAQRLAKAKGMPLEVSLSADFTPRGGAGGEPAFLCAGGVAGRIGDSVVNASGRMEMAALPTPAALKSADQVAALLHHADAKVQGKWVHGEALRRAVPWLEPLYARWSLEGPTALTATFSGTPSRGEVHLDLEATHCRIRQAGATPSRAETSVKPAGTPATLALDVRFGQVPGEVILEDCRMCLADATASVTGRLLFDDPRLLSLSAPAAWSLEVRGRAPDMATLAALSPAQVASLKPTGGVTFDVRVAGDVFGSSVERAELAFDEAGLEWLGKRVRLDGPVSYDGGRLASEGLRLGAGRSDVTLVVYVTDPADAPRGSVFVRGETIALEEVQTLVKETSERLAAWAGAPREGAAAQRPVDEVPARLANRLRRLLSRAHVSGDIELGHVTLTIPDWKTTYEFLDLAAACRLDGSRFIMPRFQCKLNDGTVAGELALDFKGEAPVLSLSYEALDLEMRDNLRPFVDQTFPGMEASGRFTHRETMTRRLEEGTYPVGEGETVLTDGLLKGPSAPDYVTSLFPGLKLTTYHFNRMSNVFEHEADGTTQNRMIFDGKSYDIFIFGATRADGTIRYTLGVDLSVSLGSKVWTRMLDQGKIPLMHYTGRIVDTQYVPPGPEIRYVLPHELAYDVFIRRNLLVQLLAQLGEKPPKIERPPPSPARRRGSVEP